MTYVGYRPNVPVPETNNKLFSQMRGNIIAVLPEYLGVNRNGQLSFFVKDGALRTFFRPECVEMINLLDDEPGGLTRKGLIDLLAALETALKKRKTILYADVILLYEADEDGSLAYLELNIRNQIHYAS
ncbi:hypothetical protein [Paenibacillus abyssi]|uniref:Uncharacterized protein n=1 Tax=Paenibacillus abyssi TaxID=1340531 RepID=A0A917G1I6_9BACL|nr:hypothetical protein [Paenibacillus abyssi]GGG18157.1 hypothetical protein GCM10010916_38700 [Paenibacillus abyssi]